MSDVAIFECPGGCHPGECDTNGPGEEVDYACDVCQGSGLMADDVTASVTCKRCKGSGKGGGYSSATCSKCGQSAINRAMWEAP